MSRIRHALLTGLVLGAVWGAVEATLIVVWPWLLAAGQGRAVAFDGVGSLAIAAMGALRYAVAGALVTPLLTLVLLPLFGRSEGARELLPARALVGFAVAVNHYWWTKPLWASSWGLPFHHPLRLAQTVGWVLLGAAVAVVLVRPRDAEELSPASMRWRRTLLVGVLFVDLAWAFTGHATLGLGVDPKLLQGLSRDLGLWPALGLAAAVAVPLGLGLVERRRGLLRPWRQGPLLVGVVVLALASGWAHWREAGLVTDSGATLAAGEKPNVLLIVLDAMRADRLGATGYERRPGISPNLDALAEEGVVLETTWAQAPFTWTSFGSMLTGKYPREHGLIKMSPTQRLDPQRNRTLAEALDDAGYATGVFFTGALTNNSGLLQGFDTYFEANVGHERVNRASRWSVVRSEMLLAILRNKLRMALDPELVNTEAMGWIREHADDSWFALVHYYSTHTPYGPPAPFIEMYGIPEGDSPYVPFNQSHAVVIMKALHTGHCWVSDCDAELGTCAHFDVERDVPMVHALYDAGVSFADAMVGDLLALLDELDLADDTLVVFTSDHGEELFDHAIFEHDWMFETNLRIPVVMRLPGRAHAGARVSWPVEEVDLPATILEVAGLQDLPDRAGRSLLADIAGQRPHDDELWVFAENVRYVSMRGERWKYTRNRLTQGERVYDLRDDPDEHTPLDLDDPRHAALLAGLRARFDAYDASQPDVTSLPTFEFDADMRQKLIELGYVQDADEGAEEAGVQAMHDSLLLGSNEMSEEDLAASPFPWGEGDLQRVLDGEP